LSNPEAHWCKFHQRFTHTFFIQNFVAKNHNAKRNWRKAAEKLSKKRLLYKIGVRKTLMELTPGIQNHQSKITTRR